MKKRIIMVITSLFIMCLTTSSVAFAVEDINRGSSAYAHISRDFASSYELAIGTRVDSEYVETTTTTILSSAKGGTTHPHIPGNTFKSVNAYVKLSPLFGKTAESRIVDSNTSAVNAIVTLGFAQFAIATQHTCAATAYNATTNQTETVADIAVFYY